MSGNYQMAVDPAKKKCKCSPRATFLCLTLAIMISLLVEYNISRTLTCRPRFIFNQWLALCKESNSTTITQKHVLRGNDKTTDLLKNYNSSTTEPNNSETSAVSKRNIPKSDPETMWKKSSAGTSKIILMHSMSTSWLNAGLLALGENAFSSCNRSCRLTLDESLVTKADTLVLLTTHYRVNTITTRLFPSPNQIWVYCSSESPIFSNNDLFSRPEWHRRFNWTLSYRRDSDLFFGYGDLVRRKPALASFERNVTAVVSGKSKMVAWFVSHCGSQSKRETIASKLAEHLQVDIYGSCGKFRCDRTSSLECYDMLSKDYYFYLSFENSLCKDYVTEKMYAIMSKVDIVPVVYGGANYSALFPKHSYIDVQQFATIRKLADYLKQVASDRKLYESYLDWKKEWKVLTQFIWPLCDLCWRSHHPKLFSKVYEDVDAWWRQNMCSNPNITLFH